MKFALIVVSDRCFRNENIDTAGARLRKEILTNFPLSGVSYNIVPDERDNIKTELLTNIDQKLDVIFTIGGTGFAPRDITPEVTRKVIQKEAPGLAYAMISESLKITPKAMLSRLVCGISQESLIINLPGSEKAAVECFNIIKDQLEHACNLIKDKTDIVKVEHGEDKIQNNFNIPSEKCVKKDIGSSAKRSSPSKVKITPSALRNRESPYPTISAEEANELIRVNTIPAIRIESIAISKSRGRVLAEDVFSPIAVPSVKTSSMDGYAIFVQDNDNDTRRTVKNVAAAGDSPHSISIAGLEAVRISTGAPIPEGANAVVMIENTSVLKTTDDGLEELEISMSAIPEVGQFIRQPGIDIALNSKVLQKEDFITAIHIGLMAAIGKTHVKVYRLPSIGVISTGNELQSYENKLEPGQIYDSNKPTIMHLLAENGFESNDCGILKDNPDQIKAAMVEAFEQNDVIITTGGVSMGEFDLIKQVITEDFEDSAIHFGRVNIKPGKPTTFATVLYKDKLKTVFGLPGNPLSAAVTLQVFVLRCLRHMAHLPQKSKEMAKTDRNIANNDKIRPLYIGTKKYQQNSVVYAKYVGDENVNSSRLSNILNANSLVIVPPGGTYFNSARDIQVKCLEL